MLLSSVGLQDGLISWAKLLELHRLILLAVQPRRMI
jgi:hypothetical protein